MSYRFQRRVLGKSFVLSILGKWSILQWMKGCFVTRRRHGLRRRPWLVLLFVLGCTSPETGLNGADIPFLDASAHGLTYVERLTGGANADEPLPLIVAIHGLGDRPARFSGVFEGWAYKARVVLPAGHMQWGDGRAWMTVRSAEIDRVDELASQTRHSADRIAGLIRDVTATRPTLGQPIVTGFSQGGMLSYAIAVHHGDTVRAAVPVSGFLPTPLYPEEGKAIAPVFGLHGATDPVLSLDLAKDTKRALENAGGTVTLRVYPNVPHRVTTTMRRDWLQFLEAKP